MKRRMAIPVYEFVPQIADFALENDDIPDLNSTLEASGTTLNSNASFQNIVPVLFSPYDEHKVVCASTKRKYDGCVDNLNQEVSDLKKRCLYLENVVKQQEHVMQKQQKTPDLALNAFNRTFNSDQVDMLLYEKKRSKQWSDKTVTESLQTKFVCGSKGYEHQRTKYPLPSERTLQRRVEDLDFKPAILYDVLELLKLKVNTMLPVDLDCGLIFDEMSIEEARSFCISDSKFYGDITIPGQVGLASHALVFVLVGIRGRWKQTVECHFTGSSIPENDLKDIAFKIIQEVESFGCRVHFLTSDCGSNNKKL